MSESSKFKIICNSEKQINSVENFPDRLTGWGQDYPVSREMKVHEKTIEFRDCFCADDFEKLLPKLCMHIAEYNPDIGFEAKGDFNEESDDYCIFHTIIFSEGKLQIITRDGYPDYSEYEDEDGNVTSDDWIESLDKKERVYTFVEGKLTEV